MSDLSRLRRLRLLTDRRAELARIPSRPSALARLRPLLEKAQFSGVFVEELDDQHVRLRYDSGLRDQWLAVDEIYEAVRNESSVEGDGQIEAAPANWLVVHFDFGSCEQSFAP